jgi:hypothetical protein
VKTCPDCGARKPLTEFNRNAARPDGLQFYCKACFSRRGAETYRRQQMRLGKSVRDRRETPAGSKWCPGCDQLQPLSNWHRNRTQRSGLVSRCKDCRRQEQHADHLRRTFGLTLDDHEHLLEQQGGVCAICGDDKPTHTDHDHVSGQVRGLLCSRCNMGIGQFLDDPVRLEAAIEYLERASVSADPDIARRRLKQLFRPAG